METAEMTDLQLARVAALGSQPAFEILYQRHYQKVYAICLRMLRNQSDAEDAAQDALIRVYRKISMFHGDSAFTTWLYSLTVNGALMYLRTKRRRRRNEPTDDMALERLAKGCAFWRQHEISIVDRIALKQAVRQLPAGYHHVFMLHDVEGFEHEEVSLLLGISVGTSKSQLHKARGKMRNLLLARHGARRPVSTKAQAHQ